jgi:predicted transcriptional regulator
MTTSGERAITATCWDASWHIASRRGRCRGSEEKAMTKQRKVRVHVESLEASGRRFVDAWRRAKRGEPIHEEHLSFESLEGLLTTLSPKRIELVRFVRRRPNLSIAALARELGRDYKRVHGDVRALEMAGLLEEDEIGLRAPFAGVDAQLSFS